jgi:predicted HD phosphohydrolase
MPIGPSERAAFRALSEATSNDWKIIDRAQDQYRRNHGAGHGLLAVMASIADIPRDGRPVNLYTHCLQTATRVLKAGHDDELVTVALFHDLAEAFSDNHHGHLAAQFLAPRLSERRSWLLVHHVELQSYHFPHHSIHGRDGRGRHIDHPHYAETLEFCELYDKNSFDPDYPTLALSEFEPIVYRFFSGPAPLPLQQPD